MRKMVLFVLILMLSFTVYAGGAQESQDQATSQPESNEITVVYLFDPPWYDQAAEFTEKTGIKVNYVEVTFPELRQRSLTSFLSQETRFDVIHVRGDWVAEFADKGFLEPIEKYLSAEDLAVYTESSLDNLKWKGELYGLPRYYWLWQFYYNQEILDEAGIEEVPTTWDELIATTPKIKAIGKQPLLTGLAQNNMASFIYILMVEEGGSILDGNGMSAVNSAAGIRAFTTLKELYDSGTLVPAALEMNGTGPATDLFVQGNHAFLLSTPHTYPMAQDATRSNVVGKVGVGVIPFGSLGTSAAWNESAGVGIPYNSQNKEQAIEFLKFVTSPEQQKTIAMKIGRIPTFDSVLNDPEVLAEYPHFASVAKQIQYPNGMLVSPYAREIADAVGATALRILYGQVSVEAGLESLEKEINNIATQ